MELIKNVIMYFVKSLYFSGLMLIPISLMLICFKKLDVKYKYKISLILFLLIPVLPFFTIPNSSSTNSMNLLVKNEYIRVIESPINTIKNISIETTNPTVVSIENSSPIQGDERKQSIQPLENRQLLFMIIFILYILTIVTLIIRLSYSISIFKREVRESKTLMDNNLLSLSSEVFGSLSIKRRIKLLTLKHISSPYSYGLFNPVIIIPEQIRYTPEEFKQIIIHETEHIRRHDYLVTWIQRLTEIILFLNPVVWFLSSTLSTYRELICDRRVIDMNMDKSSYIKVLLDTAKRNLTGVPLICNGTVSSKKTLVKRVENIFQTPKMYNKKLSNLFKTILTLIFAMTIITLGCVNTSPDNGELPLTVLQIEEEIETLEKEKFIYNIDETVIGGLLTKIENEEPILRKRRDLKSKRGLAYLLIYKADVLYLSQTGNYGEDKYWRVIGKIVSTVTEALEIIEECGTADEKGELYYYASFLYYADSLVNLEKAQHYFKEAGNGKLKAQTTLELINKTLSEDGIIRYKEDLDSIKTWAELNNDYEVLSIIRGLEYYKDNPSKLDEVYRKIGWSGFTLENKKSDINFLSGNKYSYGQPRIITKLDDIFGIHWILTGTFSKPNSSNLSPYDGITTELIALESDIEIVTDNQIYKDVQKITYDVVVDEQIYDRNTWYRLLDGINIFYYKKGVGIIQYENTNEGNTIYLSSVLINGDTDSYLPLSEGNSWTYGVKGYSEDIIKTRYRVEFMENDHIYFSNYNYEKLR